MSKKIRLRLAALLSASVILAAAIFSLPVRAQQGATAVAPANAKSAAVSAATVDVLEETSEIRQLPVLRPVKSGAQSRADIERMIIKNLDEDTTPAEMRATEMTLKKLGLVPPDFKYRQFLISLLTEQVAGYYDPKAQQFYLADWIELEGQKPVISHELTHALQDQHFNLRRFEKWPDGDSDAEIAAHALIEGDATLTMMRYIMRKPERMREFMKSMSEGGATSANELIEKAPRALRESLLFPYEKGLVFTTRLFGEGGWKMVSQAYKDLPQSTEQILHSEKYLAREAPVKIEMPDISAQLGKGWKRVVYDVNGEWSYYLILDQFLKAQEESEKAAAGWGGDRYAVYEGSKGEVFMAQLSLWDTEQDANEFYSAYVKRTNARYQSTMPAEKTTSLNVPIRQAEMETKEGGVKILQVGARILILEGIPAKADVSALVNPITRSVTQSK